MDIKFTSIVLIIFAILVAKISTSNLRSPEALTDADFVDTELN